MLELMKMILKLTYGMIQMNEKDNVLNLPLPGVILNTIHYVVGKASKNFMRDGIPLEKGAVISEKRIDKNFELYKSYCKLWSIYPDLLILLGA